ncbi:30S ribosomal protein S9 [Candidatus Woesebacteria bacterium RBG_19FT_COMBO_47_8]|uniref:Small ribosomal subunit protein uS9 n=1 Tax=Candidatus Woesebacteria bacterium RBG_13_46_13 TaxID=1802479 RepID=A0A1F7X6F3_9BACT|nr:MAG: 30S ribosomal protein S9 [Candidatus Woesebacteria bacterium RBG_13_46_13]OGM16733.1 MAG: 30S ribosomal protein S9 [Candidatus Woesebacteria bacterium RBG_19FT_COMBO_47_8]HJX59137.1 30S ribosomal protein S9 [Patescibacteria group bacterium]
MAKTKKQTYISAVGKRKTASARVRLYKGKGENMVNALPMEKYFPGKVNLAHWQKPFVLTETLDKYYVSVKVTGSGKEAQLEAMVLGIARAFSEANTEKFRLTLKKAGLVKRDSRKRQRRMVGTGGKSRRKKQSPKR